MRLLGPFEQRVIVSIPSEGVQVEVWLIPPALDLRRPPDNPPIIIPPGGEIFAMAAFPGQEARVRIVALNPNGRRVAGFSLSGSGGGTPQRRWKNFSKDMVTIHASAMNIIDQPIRLSSYDAFQEITVMGWGLEEIPDRSPVGRGPKTHDAVLMIVRSDDSPSVISSTGPGVEVGTIRVFERDEQLFVAGFPNRRARVEFQGTGSDGTPRAFWRTLTGSSGQINRNLFRNVNDVLTIDFKASVADNEGQWRPVAWQGVRINADLVIAGAGFQPMEQADDNLPYRVILFAVRVP